MHPTLGRDTDTPLYRAPQVHTGPPSLDVGANFGQPKALLLVLLADLEDSDKEKLIQHLCPPKSSFKIVTWHPSNGYLQSLAPQCQYRDSQANLYGLAIVAHRNGYSGFVVADELTKRQVEGQFPLRGEDERISVAMIAMRQAKQSGKIRVIARRSARGDNENFDFLATMESFDVCQNFENPYNKERVTTVYTELGLELQDPDRPVFTPSTTCSFGYEEISAKIMTALSKSTPLPSELALNVTSWTEKSLEEPIKLPPGLDFRTTSPNFNIILGFKTSQIERESLLSAVKDALHVELKKQAETKPKINVTGGNEETGHEGDYEPSVHLIPWDLTRSPSRRDVLNLFQTVTAYSDANNTLRLPYLLIKPIGNEEIDSAEFMSIHNTKMGPAVRQTTLNEMICFQETQPAVADFASSYESGKMELLPSSRIISGFNEPFYPISYPWNAIGRMNAIPLFFLTNKLSDEQTRALYEEIKTLNNIDSPRWGRKVICPVPWKENEPDAEDGTPADMWKLTTEVAGTCELPLVFVDQQSGIDLKVIMTEKDYVGPPDDTESFEEARELLKGVSDPVFRGLVYGRKPGRDAHITWVNLNIVNMNLEESLQGPDERYKCYLRPDWPCHDMINENTHEWIPKEESLGESST